MGDCDWAAFFDLLLENRDYAAVGAENIAETCGHKLGHALDTPLLDGLIEALAVDFADSFAAAHHVGRVHGLVGGNHHKFLCSIFHRQVGNHPGAVDVVLHRNRRVVLHHRNVFVGSGVENILRTVGGKNSLHVFAVGDA